MKTKEIEDFFNKKGIKLEAWLLRDISEYSDLTNAKLVEENEILKETNNNKATYIEEMESELSALKEENERLMNYIKEANSKILKQKVEIGEAKERVKDLEKNARQLCTLLAKNHILFFLSQGEKDGIIDILKTLTPKQHG